MFDMDPVIANQVTLLTNTEGDDDAVGMARDYCQYCQLREAQAREMRERVYTVVRSYEYLPWQQQELHRIVRRLQGVEDTCREHLHSLQDFLQSLQQVNDDKTALNASLPSHELDIRCGREQMEGYLHAVQRLVERVEHEHAQRAYGDMCWGETCPWNSIAGV